MVTTHWVNVITGERLDRDTLARVRSQAHRAYEANTHIFEDELDALAAFGVLAADEYARRHGGPVLAVA